MGFRQGKNRNFWFKNSIVILLFFIICCRNKAKEQFSTATIESKTDTLVEFVSYEKKSKQIEVYHDDFVNIQALSDDFILDLKYATTDNFLKQAVYDCAECFLRKETAKALVAANESFKKLGYRIKIFDCYRPLSVQQKMWSILPGTHYVANPAKGSKHNRGAAVDITLVDSNGNELDMGTAFDYFGKEAHHNYQNLPSQVIKNRKLLKEVMDKHNFRSIYSEWWHYEFRPERDSKIENFTWECQ
ncbi:D-alanyl-D-alanine dipeptidase [Capnocytophaga canimorsus]|uniref:D-alanyl-D-alanine dipeptidase n=1 Tax=Capnocytophaga canimorsus TaxID=28188 RepID=UPI0028E39F74|nr:D-alanyl-D-alanine dipeptidase [Capnocytophaga canimorsus]